MKKSIQNLRLRIMLVSMFAVFSSIIWAQNYGLQINNVNVTDKNCNDLSVIEGVKGKVKYTPATKTLTLEDASITQSGSAYSYAGISNQNCPDLKIELKGSNKIEPSRHYVGGKVAIAPLIKYGITVAGVEVTNLNCADLSVLP